MVIDRETESSLRKKKDFFENDMSSEECTFRPSIDPISNLIITNSNLNESLFNTKLIDTGT